jgi:hypothetical protein
MGAWTFGRLMLSLTGQTVVNQTNMDAADQMVTQWLGLWTANQTVNHFQVNLRPGMAGNVIPNWPKDPHNSQFVDISNAPFQLNAIVNRVDIGEGANPTGGEVRFVFGYAPCSNGEGLPSKFNVIFEYNVPTSVASGCTGTNSVPNWARLWQQLETDLQACSNTFAGCTQLNSDLEEITGKVVTVSANATQNINRIRSNEETLVGTGNEIWEMREFSLTPNGSTQQLPIIQTTVFETPEGDPNAANPATNFGMNTVNSVNGGQVFSCSSQPTKCDNGVLTTFINNNTINFPGTYNVPLNIPGSTQPFAGGSAFQPINPGVYWNGATGITSNTARSDFSANTCNGCHGAETQTDFQQVVNRTPAPLIGGSPQPSALSAFLVGCSSKPSAGITAPCLPPSNTCNLHNALSSSMCVNELVQDPALGTSVLPNSFGDLNRRAVYLNGLLGGTCQSDQLLRGFVEHPVHFSH